MEDLGLLHLFCILFDAMRRIELRSLLPALALVTVMLVTPGCTGDSLEASKQLALSTPNTQQEEQDTSSYTSKVSNALGSYYDNTVTFLTDDCGVGAYSMATGKAVVYGIGGGLWGASKATMYGALHYSGLSSGSRNRCCCGFKSGLSGRCEECL